MDRSSFFGPAGRQPKKQTKPGLIAFNVGADLVEEYITGRVTGSADPVDVDSTGYLTLDIDDALRDRVSVTAFFTFYPQATYVQEPMPHYVRSSPQSEVGLFPCLAYTQVTFPFDSETAFAVANPADDPVTLYAMLILRKPSPSTEDKQIHHAFLTLKEHEQKALFVRELFSLEEISDSDYFGRFILFTQNFSRTFAALPLIFRASGLMTSIPILGRQ